MKSWRGIRMDLYVYIFFNLLVISSLIINPPEYIVHAIILTLWYAYLSTAWAIISGYTGQVSLGHSLFVAAGSYATALLYYYYNITPVIGILVAIIAACMLVVIIGVPSFKLGVRGPYFTFSTLAAAQVLYYLLIAYSQITGGELGLSLKYTGNPFYLHFADKRIYLLMIFLLWNLEILVIRIICKKRIGYYLVAIREDEDAAVAVGINVFKYKIIALLLSGIFTAIGGVFYTVYFNYTSPASVAGLQLSFRIATTGLVGGARSWIGPTIGSFIITPALEYVRIYFGSRYVALPLMIYGFILLIIANVAPLGLSRLLFKGRDEVR
jgi:branched-chain amino acid transport system permease protein